MPAKQQHRPARGGITDGRRDLAEDHYKPHQADTTLLNLPESRAGSSPKATLGRGGFIVLKAQNSRGPGWEKKTERQAGPKQNLPHEVQTGRLPQEGSSIFTLV